MSRRSALALLVGGSILLAACSSDPGDADTDSAAEAGESEAEQQPAVAELTPPGEPTTVLPGSSPGEIAIATSQALFSQAPAVVLAPADDVAAQARAASAAVQLGVPLLLGGAADPDPTATTTPAASGAVTPDTETPDPPTDAPTPGEDEPSAGASSTALEEELARLGATTVLDVGDVAGGLDLAEIAVVPAPADASALQQLLGGAVGATQSVTTAELVATVAALEPGSPSLVNVSDAPAATDEGSSDAPTAAAAEPASAETLPAIEPAAPLDELVVLATPDQGSVAAAATARAAGARVQVVPNGDPRTDSGVIAALAAEPPQTVLAVGEVFGTAETVRYRLDVAATGVELPGGGQVLYPGRRMVALYGNPTTAGLGVLGEQPLPEAIVRAQDTAAQYDGLWGSEPVVPAFELISTVASEFAGPDGNYSTEMSLDVVRPWVEAAGEAGVYVVLDLQPGRTDFLTQAKIYEELLALPHVGLALDPEWRLESDQTHLVQIGSVSAAEINEVVTWLADLTRERLLPQKLLILHQFRLDMIEDRDQVDTSRDELAVLIHADGNGPPGSKFATYDALTASPPPNVWWGWKNFYDEDSPTFTPEQTVEVDPSPVFVSYQ